MMRSLYTNCSHLNNRHIYKLTKNIDCLPDAKSEIKYHDLIRYYFKLTSFYNFIHRFLICPKKHEKKTTIL